MAASSTYIVSSIATIITFSRFKLLVDIDGRSLGTLLSIILKEHQHLFGIGFDLDHVTENATMTKPNKLKEKQIKKTRYQFIPDMFKPKTIPKADAYMMKSIIHDWNDEKSIRLTNKNYESKTITGSQNDGIIE
ncbi:unnamed protein product [Didymodactylos carnosus]|uniref:O-methyltransferase C-terminal domain-containing protein n=1 Tax=Didymodactylos carnosus TaxID=1234261 RepID=A0A815WVU5_9BILA|nr:unnamed protein product [Didymodactylos carnosus]CAF1549330.1 unnamed protein product [Didymodactylos carnosus]CAF4230779.1 unnamed protein product [Didymodactylos carnosus]CAF4410231.1 unnamed protein product [Didymodactylos carnosus]